MGPSIELTSCLLPDVTVELAQKTPFIQSLASLHLETPGSIFVPGFFYLFFLLVLLRTLEHDLECLNLVIYSCALIQQCECGTLLHDLVQASTSRL